jgi:hypothetical protein
MRSNLKGFLFATGLAVLVGLSAPAQAAPLVFVSPSAQLVNISTTTDVFVNVVAQDIGEAVGGFDFDISWDDSILSGVVADVVFDPDGYWSGDASFTIQGTDFMSLFFAGDPSGIVSPIILATIKFTAIGIGNSNIGLNNVFLSDDAQPNANDIDGYDVAGGLVCVARLGDPPQGPQPECTREAPEPALMALMAAGLATVAARRRASKRS